MTHTILGNPDIFVTWTKTDTPGEDPKWESQCGMIEQTGYGDNTLFQGFVGPERKPTQPKPTLSLVKKDVETSYQKTHRLKWAYN